MTYASANSFPVHLEQGLYEGTDWKNRALTLYIKDAVTDYTVDEGYPIEDAANDLINWVSAHHDLDGAVGTFKASAHSNEVTFEQP